MTAASYLRGPAFTHLRAALRRHLDELWIIDLEGDSLAARQTENVFPIRTPVAIAMGVRYAQHQPHQAARAWYVRLTGDRDLAMTVVGGLAMAAASGAARGNNRVVAIGLVHSAVVTVGAVVLMSRLRKRIGEAIPVAATVGRALLVAAGTGAAAAGAARLAPAGSGRAGAAMSLLLGGGAGLAAAVAGYRVLAATEIRVLVAELRAPAGPDGQPSLPPALSTSGRPDGEWA